MAGVFSSDKQINIKRQNGAKNFKPSLITDFTV
jgi:hypothetical protein